MRNKGWRPDPNMVKQMESVLDKGLPWSEWRPIEEMPPKDDPAVYQLQVRNPDGQVIKIFRKLGDEDTAGVLYVGSTPNGGAIQSRHAIMRRAYRSCFGVNPKRPHPGVDCFYAAYYLGPLGKVYRGEALWYRFTVFDSHHEAQTIEALLLRENYIKFGELPPFNSKFEFWKEVMYPALGQARDDLRARLAAGSTLRFPVVS